MHDPHNRFPLGTMPSRDEIDLHIRRARFLRAEATVAVLGSAGRGIAGLARHLAGRLGRLQLPGQARSKPEQVVDSAGPRNPVKARLGVHRERRRIRRELMERSDRELEQLGIARADIPRIARSRDAA